MSLRKKLMAAGLVVCMAATIIGGATLAYFTDQKEVKNTFSVGNVSITLTEPSWVEETATLIPGRTIAKDPTIAIDAGSQDAYTFMKVQLSADFLELLKTYAADQKISNPADVIDDWFVTTVGPKIMYTDLNEGYVILGVLSPKKAGDSVTYFDKVTVPAAVKQEMIKDDGVYEINVTAYAIQAEGFYNEANKDASRQAAFEALFPELAVIP